jgi:hypothetical protein
MTDTGWPNKYHVMEELINDKDVLSVRESHRRGFNECHTLMSSEVKRRAEVSRLVWIIESYFGTNIDVIKKELTAQAISQHMTEGLDISPKEK